MHVAGDFNGWSKVATPMTSDGAGHFSVTVDLTEGVHSYKFVEDGDTWVKDPHGDTDLEADDTYGGKNSVVLVGPDAKASAGRLGRDLRARRRARRIRHLGLQRRDEEPAAIADPHAGE